MAAKHHYVPQFYIKLFKIPETQAGVFMYERTKEPSQRNTANIAFKKGFYSYVDKKSGNETEALERTFSEIEDKAKPIIDALILDQTKQLTEKEKANLVYYIAHQRTRNKAYRETVRTNYLAAIQSMLAQEVGNIDKFREAIATVTKGKATEGDVDRYRKIILEKKYELELENEVALLHQALESAQNAYFVLMKKNMYFFRAVNDDYFITSDNPVNVHFDSPFEEIYGNGGLLNSVITLPISPSLTLVLTNDDREQGVTEIGSGLVERLNTMQCHSSLDYLFSDRNSNEIKQMFNSTKRGAGQAVVVEHAGETNIFMPEND